MANEQLRERLARYIDQYKDDKESGVNMGTVGLAMGYKSGSAVVSAYLSGTYKGRVDTLEARLEEYFRNVEARTEQDSKLADIPMPKEYVKLSISERVFTSIRLPICAAASWRWLAIPVSGRPRPRWNTTACTPAPAITLRRRL